MIHGLINLKPGVINPAPKAKGAKGLQYSSSLGPAAMWMAPGIGHGVDGGFAKGQHVVAQRVVVKGHGFTG
jgi:hypothetical protein